MNVINEVTHISGVNSMYIFKLDGRNYWFFGDMHYGRRKNDCEQQLNVICDDFDSSYTRINYHNSSCVSIGSLLYSIFIYNNDHNILTDFYLESSFTKENERTALKVGYDIMNNKKSLIDYDRTKIDHDFDVVSWMTLIEFVMEPCFIKEKTRCPFYPNLRSHYVDIRFLEGNESIETDPFILYDIRRYFKSNVSNIDELVIFIEDFKNFLYIIIYSYRAILDAILNENGFDNLLIEFYNLSQHFSVGFQELYLTKIMNFERMSVIRNNTRMHRVAAELLRLKHHNPQISVAIKEFIYSIAEKNILAIEKDYLLNIKSFLNPESTENDYDDWVYYIDEIINESIDELLEISGLTMDAYTLARMFIFNDSEDIIVYAGSYHIKRYSDFFKLYFSILPIVESPMIPNNRCLQIIDLPKYFNINKYRKYAENKQNHPFNL